MKNKEILMIAAGLLAGAVALIVAKRRKPATKESYKYFKKNRHLTPAFANLKKHS